MKINLHTLISGPLGHVEPGLRDLPDHEARALIDAGYADDASAPPPAPHEIGTDEARAGADAGFAQLPRPRAKASERPVETNAKAAGKPVETNATRTAPPQAK